MKKWFIKQMANENRYYPIFLGCLFIYALIGVILFALVGSFLPSASKAICLLLFAGSTILSAGFRIAHNFCYAKVLNDETYQLDKGI